MREAARRRLEAERLAKQPQAVGNPKYEKSEPTKVTGEAVISRLKVSVRGLEADDTLASTYSLTKSQHTRISGAFCGSTFRNWLSNGRSGTLIICGNDTRSEEGALSAISRYISSVDTWLRRSKYAVPATFFCGLHEGVGDQLRGVVGMLRTLIYHIGSYCGRDLAFAKMTDGEFQWLEEGRYLQLCNTFKDVLLTASKRQGTIICIVDGAHLLETDEENEAFKIVTRVINDVMADLESWGSELTLKLLLAYPGTSTQSWTWEGGKNVVEVQDEDLYEPCDNTARLIRVLDELTRDSAPRRQSKRPT